MPDASTLALLVPITALLIPIVAILTQHQRRMAEIIHSRAERPDEIDALRREIQELKQLVHQQAIALDNVASRPSMPPSAPVDQWVEGR